jgi:hypothetical protein
LGCVSSNAEGRIVEERIWVEIGKHTFFVEGFREGIIVIVCRVLKRFS